jgi:hypothetical protein
MDGLFLGDSWEASQKDLLKKHNITHVLPVGKGLQRLWTHVNYCCFLSLTRDSTFDIFHIILQQYQKIKNKKTNSLMIRFLIGFQVYSNTD